MKAGQLFDKRNLKRKLYLLNKSIHHGITVEPNKAIISIRFDDGDSTFYSNAFPVMKERGLVGSHALPYWTTIDPSKLASGYPLRPKMTKEQTMEMLAYGFELQCHSMTHTGIVDTVEKIYEEVILARELLEKEYNVPIYSWAVPGDWTSQGNLWFKDKAYQTVLEEYLTWDMPALETYTPIPTTPRQPVNYIGISTSKWVDIQPRIDKAISEKSYLKLMTHWVENSPSSNLDVDDWVTLCDYLVQKRDSGEVEILLPTGAMLAKVGSKTNWLRNGSFESEHPSVPGRISEWNYSGIVQKISDGTAKNGTSFARIGSDAALWQYVNSGNYQRYFKATGYIRTNAGVTTGPRVQILTSEDKSPVFGSTGTELYHRDFSNLTPETWTYFEMPYCIPKEHYASTVRFTRTTTDGYDVDDVKVIPMLP